MITHAHNRVRFSSGSPPLWKMPVCIVLLALINNNAMATVSPISEFDLPKEISAANSIIVDGSGNVWFAEKIGKNLTMFDPQTKTFSVYPLPSTWGNIGPSRITYSPQGDIWFSVRRWAESVTKTNILGKFSLADHSYHKYTLPNRAIPEEVIVDTNEAVWFLSPDESRLYRFEASSAALQHYAIPTKYAYPRAISLDHKGIIWFTEANANRLAKFNPATTAFNEYQIPTRFANPGEITIDKDGKIWFVELTANRIGVFYPDLERFDEALIPTPRGMPSAIKADTNGNLWFLEYRGNKVGLFDPINATFREYNIPAFNSQPSALAIDHKRGILWFSESSTEVKKLGRLSIKAALMAQDNATDMTANKSVNGLATGSGMGKSNYIGLLLLMFALVITGVWYSRKGGLKK